MAERSVLMKNIKHPFLVGLHYSFQTTDKLYFVLDYVNGGEVSVVYLLKAVGSKSNCQSRCISMLLCQFFDSLSVFSSCSTTSNAKEYSWSPVPGSMLLRLPVPLATSTPCILFTGWYNSTP